MFYTPENVLSKMKTEGDSTINTAAIFADRNANLTVSCIGMTDCEQLIKWEKRRLTDLMEKEQLIPRIFSLQREINEMSIQIKNKLAEKSDLIAKLETFRKQKEVVDHQAIQRPSHRL
eukprot:jgi/Hompol1/1103/HPOL_001636-RA